MAVKPHVYSELTRTNVLLCRCIQKAFIGRACRQVVQDGAPGKAAKVLQCGHAPHLQIDQWRLQPAHGVGKGGEPGRHA